MNGALPAFSESRENLFISYAYEDEIFARWLARKLAFYGYGVWFDQIKLLGGESWVESVEVAISDRSFRVLGILSESSRLKTNPVNERTRAIAVGKDLEVEDFLITLNLDGAAADWTSSAISWIPFNHGWAQGLRRLLKKLDSIEAPRRHESNPAIARVELSRGEELTTEEPEEIIVNWMPFSELPKALHIYDAPDLDRKALRPWPCCMLGEGKVAALAPPPTELAGQVQETKEVHCWQSVSEIRRSSTHSIIVQILNQTAGKWLKEAGCQYTWQTKATYLPSPFREESICRYTDADGSARRINASGKVTIKKPAAPPEKVIHHPGIRYRARRNDVGSYILELKPALALFDEKHHPLEGKKIGPRQKKVTRSWYNPDWRKRFMVFAQILGDAAAADKETPFGLANPLRLTSNRTLLDPKKEPRKDELEEGSFEEEIEVGIDEMEDWKE